MRGYYDFVEAGDVFEPVESRFDVDTYGDAPVPVEREPFKRGETWVDAFFGPREERGE